VRDILARGRLPIVVVGTYLYYRALRYGLLPVPPADQALRAELLGRGAEWIAREVERVDLESFVEAGRGKNHQHLLRALEIFRLTGTPASVLKKAHGFLAPRYEAEIIGLTPEREELVKRIDARVEEMFAKGWVDEVRSLRQSGVPIDARPMQAVGYREIALALENGSDPRSAIPSIQAQTRQYARRQVSFFRQEKGFSEPELGAGAEVEAEERAGAEDDGER
jgi:tRNA dimethylallyltransferase